MPDFPDQFAIEPLAGPFDVTIDDLPGSKSLTNRALLLAALAEGASTLTNVLFSDDSRVMLDALAALGFKLEINEPKRAVTVHGQGGVIPHQTAELHLGNAGTAMRFLTAACCLPRQGVYTLDGIPRMRQRPIGELVEPLRELGAKIDYLGQPGFPPLRIHACGLAGRELTLKPTLSSQFISALLQIGPYLSGGLTLHFDGPVTSLPYVRMTTALMKQFGAELRAGDFSRIQIVGLSHYQSTPYNIEPDASNASYFFAAAAITPGSSMTIRGLDHQSLQGDSFFIDRLADMGCAIEEKPGSLRLTGPEKLQGKSFDLNAMPDMAQTLAVVALFASGGTTIRNVGNLRVKETDRIAALQNELTRLGATVTVEGDDLTIQPPRGGRLLRGVIETYDDHRMAMSFAVAGLRAPGLVIRDPGCVRKTFPDYFDYLARLRG